jgi:hypothetical protein
MSQELDGSGRKRKGVNIGLKICVDNATSGSALELASFVPYQT